MAKTITPFGQAWKELNKSALLKHKLFVRALMMSPSYQLAHLVRTDRADIAAPFELPKDFKEVLKIYDLVGNIFDVTFEEWWTSKGINLFDRSPKYERLVVNINLRNGREEIHQKIDLLIDQALELKKITRRQKLIRFQENKIRPKTIYDRLDLVWFKSIIHPIDDEGKSVPAFQWKLPFYLKSYITGDFESIFSGDQFHTKSKKTEKNIKARRYLSIVVSKNLKEALNICENAARGKFPDKSNTTSSLKFNYPWVMNASNDMQTHIQAYKKLHPSKAEHDITRKEFMKIHKKNLIKIKEKNSFT